MQKERSAILKRQFIKVAKDFRDTGGMMVSSLAINAIGHHFGIPFGAASSVESSQGMLQNPLQFLLEAGIAFPIVETAMFQGLFSFVANEIKYQGEMPAKKETLWKWGLGSAAFFAFFHTFVTSKVNPPLINFDFSYIPLQQFTGGLFLWNSMRKRGFGHTAITHGLYNTSLFTLIALGAK